MDYHHAPLKWPLRGKMLWKLNFSKNVAVRILLTLNGLSMSLLFYGNHSGSLSNTKLILKLLGWLLRHSNWEWHSIYLSWCQYMSQGPFQQVWNMFPHIPSTGEVKSPKINNFTCTYVDHSLASVPHFEYLVYVLPKWVHLEYLYSRIKHITI